MRQLKITKQITNRETKSLDKYLSEISSIEMVDANEEVELARRIKQGDDQALERLVKANLRFVVSVSKQYQNQGLTLGDLINEGNLGLIKAAQRFDETRGFKFISYAVWWIRQSILQAMAENGRLVRMPLNRIGELTKINKVSTEFEQKNERTPSEEEIAGNLELPQETVRETLKGAGGHISVDAPFSEDEENTLLNIMKNKDEPSPDNSLMNESLREELKMVLNYLSEKEKVVLIYYFGINGSQELSLEEIGNKIDLTRERVRQIRDKAIKKLKKSKKLTRLKTYL